jgi:proline iminopeptidase
VAVFAMPIAHINNTSLFFLEIGSGLPCLVMHGGLGFDHTYLHPWLDTLGDTFRLVYYDHRGNGRSGRPPRATLILEQLVEDAEALRRHLGLGKIAVLGHSYGGFIALEYALQYPQHLSHLLLLNSAPAWGYGEEIVANAVRRGATPAMLEALNVEAYVTDNERLREWYHLMAPLYFYQFDQKIADELVQNMIFSSAAMQQGLQLVKNYNLLARLREIHVPSLIVTGREDFAMPPSQAVRLQQCIPNSNLTIFERSAHFPYLEEPDAFRQIVGDWVRGQPL